MKDTQHPKKIAIVGGGPSGLFMYKHLLESGHDDLEITIYESKEHLGQGMPYSDQGANDEHVTNVSGNEIPDLVSSIAEWIEQDAPQQLLERFQIDPKKFNDYKVVPRLVFGLYLEAQFKKLIAQANARGIKTTVLLGTTITDMAFRKERGCVLIRTARNLTEEFDVAVIATGHSWPKTHEGKVDGYFDSPYPPSKLKMHVNHPVAVKGSSLTAIDAIRTLARMNGNFVDNDGKLQFEAAEESPEFRIVIHTRNGLLPAVRFHLDDSHLTAESILKPEQVSEDREKNDGFLSLDYVFEKNFKDLFIGKDPAFHAEIKDMKLEEFVAAMMSLREHLEPFVLLKLEYDEAARSIAKRESIYWKEMLAILSFAMNYPAKYFSAEDMLRLQKDLMPLISIVIAFIPQSSCRELLAMYEAGKLEIVAVGHDSEAIVEDGKIIYHYGKEAGGQEVEFKTLIDCTGQPHLSIDDFPFKSLADEELICPAKIMFRDNAEGEREQVSGNKKVHRTEQGDFYLSVPGITINDHFQVVDKYGVYSEHVYIMAVPYIGGYNPDYSGLDFSEAASKKIADRMFG